MAIDDWASATGRWGLLWTVKLGRRFDGWVGGFGGAVLRPAVTICAIAAHRYTFNESIKALCSPLESSMRASSTLLVAIEQIDVCAVIAPNGALRFLPQLEVLSKFSQLNSWIQYELIKLRSSERQLCAWCRFSTGCALSNLLVSTFEVDSAARGMIIFVFWKYI